jgi:hypothetical protein
LFESLLEWERVGDFRYVGAAGLLGGFEDDATPAFGSFEGCVAEMLFGAAGEDGSDATDAEFGGLFDGPLHGIELEDAEEEMEGKSGAGFELFVEGEVDFLFAYVGDLGAVEEAVGDDVVDLAGGGAEDACEVSSLVAGEGGGGGGPGVGDEAATSHEFEFNGRGDSMSWKASRGEVSGWA